MAHNEFHAELEGRFGPRCKAHPDRGQKADNPTAIVQLGTVGLQGSVSRSGEVVLLALGSGLE